MIKPLFQERMRRIKADRWILRFWFNSTAALDIDSVLSSLKGSIESTHTFKTEDVEAIVFRNFSPEDGLAAVEILNAGTLNGRVSYFEWP
jgi:hypothetical protein